MAKIAIELPTRIEYFTVRGTPEREYGRDEGRLRGQHFRTADEALRAAEVWGLAHPEHLHISYFDFDQEKRHRALKYPVELSWEIRHKPETLEAQRDGLDVRIIAEMEIRWLKKWKESSTVNVDGKSFSREDTVTEELEPWGPWMHRANYARDKEKPVYCCFYVNVEHVEIEFQK